VHDRFKVIRCPIVGHLGTLHTIGKAGGSCQASVIAPENIATFLTINLAKKISST